MTTVAWNKLGESLKSKFAVFPQPDISNHQSVLLQDNSQLTDCILELKNNNKFDVLSLINAVEYKTDIQITYQLMSMSSEFNIIYLKVNISKDDLKINSLSEIYSSAFWYEKELYDLHGINFEGHSDLTRLYNTDLWEGHPFRKDYIPPLDALNAPITTVKSNMKDIKHSTRYDVPGQGESPVKEEIK